MTQSKRSLIFALTLFLLLASMIACKIQTEETGEEDSPQKPRKEENTIFVDLEWADPGLRISKGLGNIQKCNDQEFDLFPLINHYADSVTGLNLSYDRSTKNDCSGTFIRLNQYLKGNCKDAEFPSFEKVRSTKDLVEYYHQLEKLIFIEDPLNSDSLIKPGSVMFYTHSNKGGSLKIDQYNMKDVVNHVGVVTHIDQNEKNGQVVNYHLFHGRNPSNGINITEYHQRSPHGISYQPYPYGNGKEQWMAVASIAIGN